MSTALNKGAMRKIIGATFLISDFIAWLLCFASIFCAFISPFLLHYSEMIFGQEKGVDFKLLVAFAFFLASTIFLGVAKRIFSCAILSIVSLVAFGFIKSYLYIIFPVCLVFIVPYVLGYYEFKRIKV